MHLDLPSSTQSSQHVYMLAIMEQWDDTSDHRTDNTVKFLMLILIKAGLDTVFFQICSWKWYHSFLNVCSLSIVVVDWMVALFMAIALRLGPEMCFLSPCFLLANASATFGELALPMICLGALDYCLDDTFLGSHRPLFKVVRNVVWMLLLWIYAGFSSFGSVSPNLIEMDFLTGEKLLVCKVEESWSIANFVLVLFSLALFTTLPFWSRIPQWVKEADRLFDERENQKDAKSDLFYSVQSSNIKSCEKTHLDKENNPPPPLWFSLILAFVVFWMPYLTVSVVCLLLGLGIPAYIAVNLLWVECANSVLTGVVFWIKSQTLGPYSNMPENMCSWHIYWHLSRGTQPQQLPVRVLNPSKGKESTCLYV